MNHNQREYTDFDALLSESAHNIADAKMKERIWEKIQAEQQPLSKNKSKTIAFTISKYAAVLAIGLGIGLLFKSKTDIESNISPVANINQPETNTAPPETNNDIATKVDTVYIVKTITKKSNVTAPIKQATITENTKEETFVAQEKTLENDNLEPIAVVDKNPFMTDKEILQHLAVLNEQQPRKKISKVEKRLQKIIDQPNTHYANSITFKNAIKSF